MEIHFNNLFGDGIGWNFGVSNWIKETKKALSKLGFSFHPFGKVSLSIGLPRAFVPVEKRFNIFMTLFETEDLFPEDYERINKADMVIVPCEHNKAVLQKGGVTKPICIATGGVDPSIFKYTKRSFPQDSKPFYFLYVGALNPRKGFDIAIKAFKEYAANTTQNTFLYVKTTAEGKTGIEVDKYFNIIYDYRVLTPKQLYKEVYKKCHCLLLPSHGEGIGLTAMEAAATGMPVIHTPYGGTQQFLKESFSLYLKYSLITTELEYPTANGSVKKLTTKWAEPDFDDLVAKMKMLSDYKFYNEFIKKSRQRVYLMTNSVKWITYGIVIEYLIEQHASEIKAATPLKILNLGCGHRQFPGTIGVDNRKEVNPDIVYDLSKTPYKFAKDNSFDIVLSLNHLEHFVDIIPIMKEYYRILKKEGELHVQVPYYKSENFFIDPTHHHAFHELSFDFFDKTTFHGSTNNYANINFQIVRREILPTGDIYFILKKKCLEGDTCSGSCGRKCSCKNAL